MIVTLKRVRLSYPSLFKATAQQEGAPAFSARFVFDPGSDNEKAVKAAIEKVATDKWKDKAPGILAMLYKDGKVAFKSDPPLDQDGKVRSGFEGKVSVSTRNPENKRPVVYDAHGNELLGDDGTVYAGCYVHASLEFWAQDNNYGRRINCNIRGVKFAADGERFSAATPVTADEFAGLDGSDADSFV